MSKKKQNKGKKYSICPVCNKRKVDYFLDKVTKKENTVKIPWMCPSCKSMGKEKYFLTFLEHSIVLNSNDFDHNYKTTNVVNVVKYLLQKFREDISIGKAIGLCYYAQAYTLAWDNRPLFREKFSKMHGGLSCEKFEDLFDGRMYIGLGDIPDKMLSKVELTDEEKKNIDMIIDNYGEYSGQQLMDLRGNDELWCGTKPDSEIKIEDLRIYYQKICLFENEE